MTRLRGTIRRPTPEDLRDFAAMEYMTLTQDEAQDYAELADFSLGLLDALDDLPSPRFEQKHTQRDPGYRPTPQEDPYNIFITKCFVKGSESGPLLGKRVGVKDCIAVAGVPMTNASVLCQGYVPEVDATVVTRLLDAGANIVGKLNMDDFSRAGTSETSAYGPVRNPLNPDFSPGGSSSGAGAAIAAGVADLCLGVDQAGSGRIPAAWTGVVGLKATHGLVPNFGLVYTDHTIDFICPIAKTVAEVAQALEVIAGPDPRDPQWVKGELKVDKYTQSLRKDVKGIRVGVLKEAHDWEASEQDVTEATKKAYGSLESLGATVKEVSLPLFKYGWNIWQGVELHSSSAMVESDGEGYWRGGACSPGWNEAFGKSRRVRSDDFPPTLKLALMLGKYLRRQYYSSYYVKAQNLRNLLSSEVDRLLQDVDLLAMPTTPQKPTRLHSKMDRKSLVTKTAGTLNTQNTCVFNLTGHPAISIPCAMRQNLPIGLELVARRFEEGLLIRAGHTYEQSIDWKSQ